MRKLSVVLGLVVLGLDLATKWWVRNTQWLHDYNLIDGFFRIHYVQNEGIAFGLFHSIESYWKPFILATLAVVAVSVVLYYIKFLPSNQLATLFSLGLLLGGILGNFAERLYYQHVTDFIEIHWRGRISWPTFNLADVAITCGVIVLLYQTALSDEPNSIHGDNAAGGHEK